MRPARPALLRAALKERALWLEERAGRGGQGRAVTLALLTNPATRLAAPVSTACAADAMFNADGPGTPASNPAHAASASTLVPPPTLNSHCRLC